MKKKFIIPLFIASLVLGACSPSTSPEEDPPAEEPDGIIAPLPKKDYIVTGIFAAICLILIIVGVMV